MKKRQKILLALKSSSGGMDKAEGLSKLEKSKNDDDHLVAEASGTSTYIATNDGETRVNLSLCEMLFLYIPCPYSNAPARSFLKCIVERACLCCVINDRNVFKRPFQFPRRGFAHWRIFCAFRCIFFKLLLSLFFTSRHHFENTA